MTGTLVLDGSRITLEDLVRVSRDPRIHVKCASTAMERVARGWRTIEAFAAEYKKHPDDPKNRVYGVTTGFGEFKDKWIPPEELENLQRNLLLSHAVGIGENGDAADPTNYFPGDVVRGSLLIRLNTFLRGNSGVSPRLVEVVEAMLNSGVIARVPIRGSVGSSGDLCPLCHTFILLLGHGHYYIANQPTDLSIRSRDWIPGSMAPPEIRYDVRWKEGLALSNGATYSAAMLALGVHDAEIVANTADVAAAMTLEAVCGRVRALDPRVHAARGMRGQQDAAANIRNVLHNSSLADRAGAVQDAYSIRCAPQVHGASRDSIAYARMVAEAEINAVTDNPLFFEGETGGFSQGNFHGQPLALAGDFLGIALAELANISERRIQLLLDKDHNRNLPANLTPKRGVNSGWMIAQYTAAGLVSENKVLAHPASVDSIPTSANSEDHNSMSTIACRKMRTILGNVQAVIGIELLVAAQAVEWRVGMNLSPDSANTVSVEDAIADARRKGESERDAKLKYAWYATDTELRRFVNITAIEHRPVIAWRLGEGTSAAYLCIRSSIPAMTHDRYLSGDVCTARELVATGVVAAAVASRVPLNAVQPLTPR